MNTDGKWIVETEPEQIGDEKSDYCGWLKMNDQGRAYIHIQFPHWFGKQRCADLAQNMCNGMNAETVHVAQPRFSNKHPEGRYE